MSLIQIMRRMLSVLQPSPFSKDKSQEPIPAIKYQSPQPEHELVDEIISEELLKFMRENTGLMNSKFDERRDILVLPDWWKDEDLAPEARAIVRHLTSNNKVIRLKFINKPATVRV